MDTPPELWDFEFDPLFDAGMDATSSSSGMDGNVGAGYLDGNIGNGGMQWE